MRTRGIQFKFMPGKGTTDAIFIAFMAAVREVSDEKVSIVLCVCRLGEVT